MTSIRFAAPGDAATIVGRCLRNLINAYRHRNDDARIEFMGELLARCERSESDAGAEEEFPRLAFRDAAREQCREHARRRIGQPLAVNDTNYGQGGRDKMEKALAKRNTGYARGFADSVGLFVPPAELEDDTPAGEAARKRTGDHFNYHARFEFNIPGITFGGRYDGSPVIASDGTAPPPDTINDYVPSACPGGRPPHVWLPDGRSLYDTFGPEFTLLRLGPNPPDVSAFVSAAREVGMPLTVLDQPSREIMDLYGSDLALIRPDQIVSWRRNGTFNPTSVVRTVCGYPA